MSIRLLEPAQAALDEAVGWYAGQAPGLGNADRLLVLAVAHQHRKPGYWRNRALSNQ